ncbi:MAG TPA: M56 family metallopeptidase [Vicinamibacterales bacterium]|nr:M56 family metallopeptidase [Vicinamibacterales bacterium]
MTITPWQIAIYSLQLASLTAVALLMVFVFRLRAPKWTLRFWQAIVLAAVALPVLQPPAPAGQTLFVAASAGSATLTSPGDALAWRLGVDGAAIIMAIIAAGIGLRILWLAVGMARVRSLTAGATSDASIAPLVQALNDALGTGARVLISDELDGPATIGVRRPVVLLPRAVLGMSPAVQRAIICHELMHVIRRDWLHTIAEEALCATLWFHPAARLITARVSTARETVVDELTIAFTRDRRAYAEALLAFSDPQPHLVGVTPFIGRHSLSQRIALLAQETSMSPRHAVASLLLALFASAGVTAAVVDRFPITAPVRTTTVYKPGSGISLPTVVNEVKPAYTAAAMQAKIQGSVWLACVVDQNGDIAEVKVTRSLDKEYGLDDQAIAAARQWKFRPGRKDGKPVAVEITLELTFTLRK